MNNIFKPALFLIVFFFVAQHVRADNIVMTWSFKDVQGVNDSIVEAATRLSVEEIEKKNPLVTSWPEAFLLMIGANQHKSDQALYRALVPQLTDKTKADLKETAKLIIWERITSGELQFEGRGYQVSDDLFTVAGRANWMLRNNAKKNFGYVTPTTSAEELAVLQQKWMRWLKGELVEEYHEDYVPTGKWPNQFKIGLTSLAALEALITTLKPSQGEEKRQKEKLRKNCEESMRGVYGLSPEFQILEICRFDVITLVYLASITGIRDKHGYDWWTKWWETNKNQLIWNQEKAIFQVRK